MASKLDTYSYSKINRFKDCPLSFYKCYIEKNEEKVSSGITEFGLFGHDILERYFKGE